MSVALAIMLASGTMQFSGAILPAPESELVECKVYETQAVCECMAPKVAARVNRFNIGELLTIREEEIRSCKEQATPLSKTVRE